MSDQLTHDLSLMLMYLSSWTERPDEARRFWKGFEFDILNQLAEEGLISDSRRAKSAYLTEDGLRRARELLATCCVHSAEGEQGAGVDETEEPEPAIVRLYAGADQQSDFEALEPRFTSGEDRSESADLFPGSGILVRRFEAGRTNPWHHAPGRYAVFTLCGAVDISVGDGTVRRIGSGQVLIAEDQSGQGHETREVGPTPRVSVFVPLP